MNTASPILVDETFGSRSDAGLHDDDSSRPTEVVQAAASAADEPATELHRSGECEFVSAAGTRPVLARVDAARNGSPTHADAQHESTSPHESRALPPRHKTAILVLTGLYPLVLTLDVVLGPVLRDLPRPVGLLLSLTVSVTVMVSWVQPGLTRLFSAWLYRDLR